MKNQGLRNITQMRKEIETATNKVKIPEILIEQLKSFGKRFIKVEPPEPNNPKSGKAAVEREFQKHPYNANDKEILEWLDAGGNYGILCGKGIIVIETDNKKMTEKLDTYKTFKTQSGSGRGRHHMFMSDVTENGVLTEHKTNENLGNIQANNKYVVGAGCRHFTGGLYKIIDDSPISWISKKEIEEIFSGYIVWTGQKRKELEEESEQETEQIGQAIPLKELINLSELQLTSRNEYQGSHPLHGSSTGQNFCVNTDKNVWHCFRCNSGGGGLMWIAVKNGILKCHEAQKGALRGEKFVKTIKLAQEQGFDIKLFDEDINPDVERFFEKTKDGREVFRPAFLAKELMSETTYVTRQTDEWLFRYIPEKGVYDKEGEAYLKGQIIAKIGKHLSINRQNETINYVKVSTFKNVEEDKSLQKYIVLKNGVLDLNSKKLLPFNPEMFILNAIDIEYKPEANCKRFKEFLNEVTKENDQKVLQEFAGFCLLRNYRYQKCLLLVGEGANGKSTFLETLRKLVGEENVCNEPLQTLITNRFALGQLYGKIANIYPDLPDIALKNTGYFKMLTGNDTITGEHKFKNRFSFRNYAKLIFSCNKIPQTPDDTTAFFRRWIIINFPNQFLDDNPKTDKRLLEKLTTPEELSGILNWALEGLERLLIQDRFSTNETVEETRARYLQASDPVKAFAETCIEVDAGHVETKDDVYKAFIEYCAENNLPTIAKNAFSMALPQHIPSIVDTRTYRLGKQARAWQNIRLLQGESDKSDATSLLKFHECNSDKTEKLNRKPASLLTLLSQETEEPSEQPPKDDKVEDSSAIWH